MSGGYTAIFGGGQISPALDSYVSYTLSAILQLVWPQETAPNGNLLAQIVEISNASTGAFGVTLPAANMAGVGSAVLVNNLSSFVQVIYSFGGNTIASVAPGAVYFVYLQDNSTTAGTWFAFQYGSAISAPSVGAIAGAGLIAKGSQLAQDIPVVTYTSNYVSQIGDLANLLNAANGCGQITLPLAASCLTYVGSGKGWYVQVRNSSTSTLNLQLSGSDTINGGTAGGNLIFNPGDSAIIVTDGSGFYTIGLGTTQPTFFNFQSFDITGLASPLSVGSAGAPSVNKIVYKITGALTADLHVIVPAYPQTYWVDNETSGAFNLIFQVGTGPSGTSVAVPQGLKLILYSDGANVINAVSGTGIAVPVPLIQGGSGVAATTTAQALGGFGATSQGIAVLQAATPAAAQTAQSVPSTADAFIFGMIL